MVLKVLDHPDDILLLDSVFFSILAALEHQISISVHIALDVVEKVLGADKDKAITCRPADLIEPGLAKFEEECKQWKQQDEDVLSYALFPQVATDFFKYRLAQQEKVDVTAADTKNGAYPV